MPRRTLAASLYFLLLVSLFPNGAHSQEHSPTRPPQDQTPAEVIDKYVLVPEQQGIQATPSTPVRGTGIFLLPDLDSKEFLLKKVFVPNLTYNQAVQRGAYVGAFKWIPNEMQTLEQLRAMNCGPRRCEHHRQCDAGCVCDFFQGCR